MHTAHFWAPYYPSLLTNFARHFTLLLTHADLTGNSGGVVYTAYAAVALLYPEVLSLENKYPWLNQYDRIVGSSGQFLLQNGLDFDGKAIMYI